MDFCALASGSSGNSFYVEHNDTSILVDAGISAREISKRLKSIGKDVTSLSAIFITHEHVDHIRGVEQLSSQFGIPIYGTSATLEILNCNGKNAIHAGDEISIDGMNIRSFSKNHDAKDPVSYRIDAEGSVLSVLTDIGKPCTFVIDAVKKSDALILESNHDVEMLKSSRYPAHLKKRVASESGHLSNYDAALLVLQHAPSRLKHVMLAHMSEENNSTDVALNTFRILKERLDLDPHISISTKHTCSEYIRLNKELVVD